MKAADLDDRLVLMVVKILTKDKLALTIWEVCGSFYYAPPKVVHAKLRKLIRRGLLDGCYCGCRGDFQLTEAGHALIEPPKEVAPDG